MLVALAVGAVPHTLHFRVGVGFHRLPLALRVTRRLLRLLVDRLLAGSDICLGLGEARLDLLVIFVLSLFEGSLQVRYALL